MIINKGQKVDGDPGSNLAPEVKVSVPAAQPVPVAAPVTPVVSVAPTGDPKIDALMALVMQLAENSKISALRESRLNQVEMEEQERRRAKFIQRMKNRSDDEGSLLRRQAVCSHLKGGKHRRKNAAKDYNVSLHSYILGDTVVRCLNCRMKWTPLDTPEALVRNGFVYKNHTKIGWRKALEMVQESTNQFSRSEMIGTDSLNKVKRELAGVIADAPPDIDTNPIGVYQE